MSKADELIKQLQLTPHPEGGYYRETFRDSETTAGRANSTAIYFLLKQGEVSKELSKNNIDYLSGKIM
jgi:predicted cupin superfamily sugar epimerase